MSSPYGFPRSGRLRDRWADRALPASTASTPGQVEAELHALFSGPLRQAPALLLVASEEAHRGGWGAEAAAELATIAAAHVPRAVLVDLGVDAPQLHGRLGTPNEEGITEVVLFGVSLLRTVQPVAGRRFVLLPAGVGTPDPAEVLASPRWERLVAEAVRRDSMLLLYAPAGLPGLDRLAGVVGRALVLTGGHGLDAPPRLPDDCEVVAVLSPGPAEGPAAEATSAQAPPGAALPVVDEASPAVLATDDADDAATPGSLGSGEAVAAPEAIASDEFASGDEVPETAADSEASAGAEMAPAVAVDDAALPASAVVEPASTAGQPFEAIPVDQEPATTATAHEESAGAGSVDLDAVAPARGDAGAFDVEAIDAQPDELTWAAPQTSDAEPADEEPGSAVSVDAVSVAGALIAAALVDARFEAEPDEIEPAAAAVHVADEPDSVHDLADIAADRVPFEAQADVLDPAALESAPIETEPPVAHVETAGHGVAEDGPDASPDEPEREQPTLEAAATAYDDGPATWEPEGQADLSEATAWTEPTAAVEEPVTETEPAEDRAIWLPPTLEPVGTAATADADVPAPLGAAVAELDSPASPAIVEAEIDTPAPAAFAGDVDALAPLDTLDPAEPTAEQTWPAADEADQAEPAVESWSPEAEAASGPASEAPGEPAAAAAAAPAPADPEELSFEEWLVAAGLAADAPAAQDEHGLQAASGAPPADDFPADAPPVADASDDMAGFELPPLDASSSEPADEDFGAGWEPEAPLRAEADAADPWPGFTPSRDSGTVAAAEEPVPVGADAEDEDEGDEDPPSNGPGGPGAGLRGPAPRYIVPRLSRWKERLTRWLAVVTLALWTAYIVWRWGYTLNPDALLFSVPLALAETWGLISAFIMVHSVWRLKHRTPPPAPEGLRVDVFVTCYDEPLEVIRRTAIGARAILYPHQTYILDDGKRSEVRAMAEELGLRYLRREGNEHAKAGNLNHALAHTDGDFILQLDADHVPLPNMLDRLLGFFDQDPKLAFVQSPQDFYNTDGFTYDVDETTRRIWEEQRLFFAVLQPGKDRVNGAFFCGSCAVIRRAALDDIGGFSTETVTEDIETSLKLHAAGWNSAYYGESLAYGLAAGSAAAFHTQHLRWGQGAMQVLRKFNPLTRPGLTLGQRISYFGSLTAYVNGVQKLIFLLAPIVFFLTGVLPIRALNAEFLARFLPVLGLSLLLAAAVSRGTGDLWISERYHVAKFWTYTRAVFSLFHRRPLRFHVTPKGESCVPFRSYAPQVVLVVATVLAATWALAALRYGWIDYGEGGWTSPGFVANVIWASINFGLAMSVVELSFKVRQQRGDHRFRDHLPIRVQVPDGAGAPAWHVALTEDLNPGGTAFRTGQRLQAGTPVNLTLPLATGTVQVTGRVVHSVAVAGTEPPMFRSGVVFSDVPIEVRDAIELHCTHHAVPMERARYRPALRLVARMAGHMRNNRREPRTIVQLPAQVWTGQGMFGDEAESPIAFLEEISRSGARLVLDRPLAPGTTIWFRVPGTPLERTGRVVFSRATETPIGVRYTVGVSHPRPAADGVEEQPLDWLFQLVRQPVRYLTSGV